MSRDIRWKRSLENLGKALTRLGEVLHEPLEKNDYVLDATIQRFEFVIELFWKTLKHLLAVHGRESTTPRDTLRKAYAVKWLDNEKLWLEMMDDRNMTSHIYKEETALQIYRNIQTYYPEMQKTYDGLKKLFEGKTEK